MNVREYLETLCLRGYGLRCVYLGVSFGLVGPVRRRILITTLYKGETESIALKWHGDAFNPDFFHLFGTIENLR